MKNHSNKHRNGTVVGVVLDGSVDYQNYADGPVCLIGEIDNCENVYFDFQNVVKIAFSERLIMGAKLIPLDNNGR